MADYTLIQADAFADRLFSGNPAAVMVLDAPLPDDLMQAIAAENNLSETAFVLREGDALSIRWFTPTSEVPFCGHATLASAHVLMTEYGVNGPVSLQTRKVGTLRVSQTKDGYELDLPRIDATPLTEVPPVLREIFPGGGVAEFRKHLRRAGRPGRGHRPCPRYPPDRHAWGGRAWRHGGGRRGSRRGAGRFHLTLLRPGAWN